MWSGSTALTTRSCRITLLGNSASPKHSCREITLLGHTALWLASGNEASFRLDPGDGVWTGDEWLKTSSERDDCVRVSGEAVRLIFVDASCKSKRFLETRREGSSEAIR